MSYAITSISGDELYVAKDASDVRAALEAAAHFRANLSGANLFGANLFGAKGINPRRYNALLVLLDQPGAVRAYKLTDAGYRSPIQASGKLTYHVGDTLSEPDADANAKLDCAKGINVATLPWCMQEWRTGYHIMLVEFTAADIAAIPAGDGKFRVRKCTVVGELDLVELGLTEAPAVEAKPKRTRKSKATA